MNSPPTLHVSKNAIFSSIWRTVSLYSSSNVSDFCPLSFRLRKAISASRFKSSMRVLTNSIRSKIVSSFVLLSTTWGGVATFPQSWSQAAMYNSYRSSSPMEKSLYFPSVISATASASIMVINGTRLQ